MGPMRKGSTGNDVLMFQQALTKHALHVATDGNFGPRTEWAVRAFQRRKGLLPDGIAGRKTLAALGIGNGIGIPPPAKQATIVQATIIAKPQPQQNWLSDLIARLGQFIQGPAVVAQHQKPPPTLSTAPAQHSTSKSGAAFIYRHEAVKGISERLHWPGGASGVTLGPGYDMKERSAEQITRDLQSIGLSASSVTLAAKGAKLKDDAARTFAENNKSAFSLSATQEVQLLQKILPAYERIVRSKIRIDLLPHEFDALVSFAYNPGARFARVSDLINSGKVAEAMSEIKKANTSKGKIMKGLVRRREDEVKLYLYGEY